MISGTFCFAVWLVESSRCRTNIKKKPSKGSFVKYLELFDVFTTNYCRQLTPVKNPTRMPATRAARTSSIILNVRRRHSITRCGRGEWSPNRRPCYPSRTPWHNGRFTTPTCRSTQRRCCGRCNNIWVAGEGKGLTHPGISEAPWVISMRFLVLCETASCSETLPCDQTNSLYGKLDDDKHCNFIFTPCHICVSAQAEQNSTWVLAHLTKARPKTPHFFILKYQSIELLYGYKH